MLGTLDRYTRGTNLVQALVDSAAVMITIFAITVFMLDHTVSDVMPLAGSRSLSVAAGMFFVNTTTGFYKVADRRSAAETLLRLLLTLVLALTLTYLFIQLLPSPLRLEKPLIAQIAAMTCVAVVILRRGYVSANLATNAQGRTRALIFGTGEAARVVGDTLRSADPNAHIVGYFPGANESEPAVPISELLSSELSLREAASQHRVDEIVVALTERRAGSMPLRELLDCKLAGMKIYDINTHFEKRLGQIRIDYVNAGWLIFGDGFNQGTARTLIKRTFDVLFASLLIVVSAPIMLLAALCVKLDSRGPVLYRQERIGLNGVPFMVAKFRSMRTDAESDGKPRWAAAGDGRVTRVGRIIRKLRVDELPQLFNVLRGEMSLVGPRPERPFFVEQLTQQIPFFAVRHSVKPGVTGWAQVRYQYGSTVEDALQKLQYDLFYVKNHSLFLDLLVMFETVGVVLLGKGAR